ncbi:aspartate/glutamate racemase family protein [Patescibacteria group bacterium]|nr:aspartate/glutamate racemase family protein [Patescibacteria group bacterium]
MTFGFFDSGMGGLLMMQSSNDILRGHSCVYLGDTKHLPYGPQSSEEILNHMTPCLLWLFEQKQCDYVVVACNTASAQALGTFVAHYPLYQDRVINIIDVTKQYLREHVPQSDNLVVLATQRTVRSGVYAHGLNHHITQVAMPGLVNLIELGDIKGAQSMVSDALAYHSEANTILLGCTHYIALEEELTRMYPNMNIIGQDIILNDYLVKFIVGSGTVNESHREYYVSQNPHNYTQTFSFPFQLFE